MAITLSSAPADEKSVEVAIQHARDAVTEAQEDDGWVLIKAEMLSLLLDEIKQLRLDREQHAGNATAVLQAQQERDAAMAHVQALNERITVIPSPSALCALLGCKLQQVHVHDVIEDAGTADDVPVIQLPRPIARCSRCERLAANSMAGQRCYVEDECGVQCTGMLFTVT